MLRINKYEFISKELQGELGLDEYAFGWRNYDPALARFNKIDRFAEKYFAINPYHYTADNPVFFREIAGDSILTTIQKRKGKRDLLTIHMTGKIINYSKNDVDMKDALNKVKTLMESEFKANDIDGKDVNFSFEFSIAKSMKDVDKSDHLIVLAEPTKSNKNVSGIANMFGGKIAVVDADYFTGIWDKYIGNEGARTTAHELGHLMDLKHSNNPTNIMSQGASWLRGDNVSKNQLQHIIKFQRRLNKGSNSGYFGTPNLSKEQRNYFELYKWYSN